MTQNAIRILLVDDESAIRRALRPPLIELGFQVADVSRGEEALQTLRSGAFDVVLLDVNMPGMFTSSNTTSKAPERSVCNASSPRETSAT